MNIAHPLPALSDITDAAAAGTCILDMDGRVKWVSGGLHSLFGAGVGQQVVGSPFVAHWCSDDRAAVARGIANAVQHGCCQVSCHALPTGHRLTAEINLRRDARGEPLELIVGIALSQQTPGEQIDARMLFDAVPVVMWVTHDPNAMVILGNPESERRYGFASGSNQSLSQPAEKVHNEYRYFRDGREVPARQLPMQRAVKGARVRDEEYEVRFRDGRIANVILSASPMFDAAGNIKGCACVEIDITKRKRAENVQQRLLTCSRATGTAFFDELVSAIADTLGACQVYVAELLPDDTGTLRTLAARINGEPGTYGDFIPDRTPCAEVAKGETKFISRGVQAFYPDAVIMRQMNAESYIGAPLRATDGQILGIIGVLHSEQLDERHRPLEVVEIFAGRAAGEIQRMRVEASLRTSEQEYRIITDAIPALVIFIDTQCRFRFVNAAITSWFGVEPKEAKGQHLRDVIGWPAFAKIEERVRAALSGQRQKFEAYMPYARGGARHVSAEYVPYLDGDHVRGFFALITDVSDHKAAANALSKSEAQFRTLFEHLPVGAALVDRQGTVLLENDVFARLCPVDRVARHTPDSVFKRACTLHADDGTPLSATEHPVRQALRGRVARDVEFQCRYAGGRETWLRMSGIPIFGEGEVTGALVVVADIQSEKLAEARRTLLINELNHRVKNTLASVQSIAAQTFRTSELTRDGLAAFEDRLLALSDAHNLLTREHWEGADLKQLASIVLEPHDPGGDRLRTDGPSVRLKPQAALAFAMALHELATNAVKYGSLSTSEGRLELTWSLSGGDDARALHLTWRESDGPSVKIPTRRGFGTRLIERSLAFELCSTTNIRFDPAGLVCEIEADLREIVG